MYIAALAVPDFNDNLLLAADLIALSPIIDDVDNILPLVLQNPTKEPPPIE